MKTIAIATHKGGAGKTVTAMALAAGFARIGARTLLVDVDPQGHSTIGLDIDVHALPSIAGMVRGEAIATAPYAHGRGEYHLEVLGSDIRLEREQYWLYGRLRREQFLETVLTPLRPQYDVCVIDCPPSLGVLTEGAVAAADLVLVPCQMEARATDGLVDLLEVISVLKGPAFVGWHILRTRVDVRKASTNAAVEATLEPWRDQVLPQTIPQCEPLNQAQMCRRDIFTHAPSCTGAIAYRELVERLRELLELGVAVAV